MSATPPNIRVILNFEKIREPLGFVHLVVKFLIDAYFLFIRIGDVEDDKVQDFLHLFLRGRFRILGLVVLSPLRLMSQGTCNCYKMDEIMYVLLTPIIGLLSRPIEEAPGLLPVTRIPYLTEIVLLPLLVILHPLLLPLLLGAVGHHGG